ncbi:uncharacterized protein LOC122010192 isoform X1 [Zingiber officinale]|uniref:uncharacterized protein LOC122010192 isoform X1 n=2 Tax=Zingiber officinale TaxID=94328 RepID=UPI001C4BC103|nr:uncharacterized protein LOC122010192 isoform X1 [Zingiber officinale]
MADGVYHSPQFSENAAWLPAWLQPDSNDSHDNEKSNSLLRSEDLVYPQDVTIIRKNTQPFGEHARYADCLLHLSGDDETPGGCTSETRLHFPMYLSSSGIPDTTSIQLNEANQDGKEKILVPVWEANPEIAVIQGGSSGQPQAETGEAGQNVSRVGCTLGMPENIIGIPFSKSDQEYLPGWKGIREVHKLGKDDAHDTVELCVAASEAMAISDAISSGPFENLTATTVLEIVLRMKEMRKACDLVVETCPASVDEVDELDNLFDIDEQIMEYAYNDVGISIAHIAESPRNMCSVRDSSLNISDSIIERHHLQPNSLSDTNTYVSETLFQCIRKAEKQEFEDQEPDKNDITVKKYDYSAADPNTSSVVSTTKKTRCLQSSGLADQHGQSITQKQVDKNLDDTAKNRKGSEHGEILLDGNFSRKVKAFSRKHMKKSLNWETSYISESEDGMDENQQEQMEQLRNEIISSSSTPLQVSTSVCKGKVHDWEGIISSHDLVQSSHLSLVDPFSSFVPCSIVSNDVSKLDDCNKEIVGGDSTSSKERFTGEISSSGRVTLSHCKETFLSYHLSEDEECDLPKFSFSNKRVCKPHNILMPCLTSPKNNILPNKQIQLHTVSGKKSELPFAERDGPRHSYIIGSKDQQDLRLSPVLETEFDKLAANDKNEKIFVDIKKRRYQACPNDDDKSDKRCSLLEMTKHQSSAKRVHFLDAICMDQSHDLDHKINTRSKLTNKFEASKKNHKSGTSCIRVPKERILHGLEFLLTGFPTEKEKELEALIFLHGGYTLGNVPRETLSLRRKLKEDFIIRMPPIILSPKKVKTTKFLYGCAINTWTLESKWLFDSVHSGFILPPWKYMTRPIQITPRQLRVKDLLCIKNNFFIFKQLHVMLDGKLNFCSKFSRIIKHGGGRVFSTLCQLTESLKVKENTIGVVLVENGAGVSRHLKHCLSEYEINVVPVSWIINCLFSGKLLPLKKHHHAPFQRIKVPKCPVDMSQEI